MSFESFYGGRIGASIVIVKHFDGIDIPENSEYTFKYCALNSDGTRFLTSNGQFIERDASNYLNNYRWGPLVLNGQPVDTEDIVTHDPGTVTTTIEYAIGMKQCFKKKGDSTNEVNYGEYVIIDTLHKNNPDNGKVFRRGMDYDTDLGGAEYIGQIVGPQGETPEVFMNHYDDIDQDPEQVYYDKHTGTYEVETEEEYHDILPGYTKTIDPSTGIVTETFNDKIFYISANVKNEYGDVYGCVLGFKLPYLIDDFVATSVSAYDERYRRGTQETGYYYEDLIEPDPDQYKLDPADDTYKWEHPFYHKWQVHIPNGIHGANTDNIEIVHTKTMPAGYKSDNFRGVEVFYDPECQNTTNIFFETSRDVLKEAEDTTYQATDPKIYDADPNVISCQIELTESERPDPSRIYYYVKKEECCQDVVRYREVNYDNVAEGEYKYYYIGSYNNIQRVTLSENGVLSVFYNGSPTPQELEEVIRWIDTDASGITIAADGTVTVTYNTLIEDPITHQMVHEKQVYPQVLDWITAVSLQQNGDFDIMFNNTNLFPSGFYHTQLEWIDWIDIEDGIVYFYNNTNHQQPIYVARDKLKVIQDLAIETANSSGEEGTGDQKVHVTYNTKHDYQFDPATGLPIPGSGIPDTEVIGQPLNYIIEAAVYKPDVFTNYSDYNKDLYDHFIVYYADPALRQSLSSQWVSYPSAKYPGTTWTEWVDLGDIRGDSTGLRILTDVSDISDLDNTIPPERMTNAMGQYINPNAAGWGVTVTPGTTGISTLYYYDYDDKVWYPITDLIPNQTDPKSIIVKSAPVAQMPRPNDVNMLKENGFWLASETAYYAN